MIKKLIFLLIIVQLISCTGKEDIDPDTIQIEEGGVFILNEGNFSAANSSLSYYFPATSEINNNLFYQVNDVPLGDVAQSMTINKNIVYLIINNSGNVYGINRETLEFEGKISGLISPREMVFINDQKAYISDLYSTAITIVNPENFEITGNIEIGKSSECMVKSGNRILVANWSAYNQTGINNTIMVIDTETDALIDSIVVGIEPNSVVIDRDELLWVMCSGGFMNDELPTLWKINPGTLEVEKALTFTNILQSPDNLCINGTLDTLYFLNKGVFCMSVYDQELPDDTIISEDDNNYYAVGIDPVTNEIYVSDVLDYNQNGMVFRYSPTGNLISSFEAGIIPGCFEFN
ncbi:MAG: YncE family protein [Bacteroidetes bacterium]|nr:YncE family protein [Bacteroidota bacterium]MBL6944040.1 YncE family protein [Bacteroidales bacterium]